MVNDSGKEQQGTMSGHDAKYFTTTKKGEIHELKEELNSQYKVRFPFLHFRFLGKMVSFFLFEVRRVRRNSCTMISA